MEQFTLTDSRHVSDIDGDCLIYTHNTTGAIVAFMRNKDSHRTMSIAFRTPPSDNGGIPHIIEHAVFCGSKKYNLNDPFVELMKGTMYTFLNAMTYSDATVFPVAGTNQKDFDKLVDVYLDAVFNPLLLKKPSVYAQEGWQYEVKDGHLSANGVVLNEMKGLENTSEFVLENTVKAGLFGDNSYRYVSGGVPDDIVKHRYEDMVKYYEEYYHPSNCIIIFYGDIDIEARLSYLHDEYLGKYRYKKIDGIIPYTEKTPKSTVHAEYPGDSDFMAYGVAVNQKHTAEDYIALRIIDYVLCSAGGAFLREEMMKSGICEDFDAYLDDGVRQPYMVFQASYCKVSKARKFRTMIDEALSKLAAEGAPQEMIDAALKIIEFSHKEGDYTGSPKGLVYSDYLLEKLLYNEPDPISRICIDEAIERMKECADSKYISGCVQRMFVGSRLKRLVVVRGRKRPEAKKEKKFARILAKGYRNCSNYGAEQEEKSNPYAIPVLDREDIDIGRIYIPTQKKLVGNVSLWLQNRNTHGIGYLNLAMDIRILPKELIPYVRILVELLGMINTKKHGYSKLNTLMDKTTGGIYSYIEIADRSDCDEVIPYFVLHSSFFYEELEQVFMLNLEILYESLFDDRRNIRELLMQLKSVYVTQYEQGSASVAKGIAAQGVQKAAVWQENLQGYEFYLFLCGLLDNYDSEFDALAKNLKKTLDILTEPDNIKIFYIGEEQSYAGLEEMIVKYSAVQRKDCAPPHQSDYALVPCKKAYTIASNVNYIALCTKLPDEVKKHRGHILVLEHIINCDYLWEQVRVKGGAYGSQVQIDTDGSVSFTSARDPRLCETIEAFKAVPQYIAGLNLTERELKQYIVGTMNKLEVPASAEADGMIQLRLDMAGIANDEILAIRKQIVDTELSDLTALSDYFAEALKDYNLVVVGCESMDYKSTGIDDVKPILVS